MLKNEEIVEIFKKSISSTIKSIGKSKKLEINFNNENFFVDENQINLSDPNIEIFHIGGKSHNPSINFEMELSRNWHWMWSQFYFQKKHNGYLSSFVQTIPKFFSTILRIILYSLLLNKGKLLIYLYRLKGIISGILGQSSWYRPKIKK